MFEKLGQIAEQAATGVSRRQIRTSSHAEQSVSLGVSAGCSNSGLNKLSRSEDFLWGESDPDDALCTGASRLPRDVALEKFPARNFPGISCVICGGLLGSLVAGLSKDVKTASNNSRTCVSLRVG